MVEIWILCTKVFKPENLSKGPSNEMGERENSFVYPSDVSDISCDQNSYSDIEEESDDFLARENDGTESILCPFPAFYPAELSKRDRTVHRESELYGDII